MTEPRWRRVRSLTPGWLVSLLLLMIVPGAVAAQSPTPQPSCAPQPPVLADWPADFPAYQPPPQGFDLASGSWLTGVLDDAPDAWRTRLDGSEPLLLATAPAYGVTELADGRVVSRIFDEEGPYEPFVVSEPGGAGARQLDDVAAEATIWVVAEDPPRVVFERVGERERDLGTWVLPVDGGPARRVLPPLPRGLHATMLVAHGDRVVRLSSASYAMREEGDRMDARVGDRVVRLPAGRPVGFDRRGDLVYATYRSGHRWDYRRYRFEDGTSEPLYSFRTAYARVVADGRFLVAHGANERDMLEVVDLRDGRISRWRVPGDWWSVPWGTRDTVMLQGTPAGGYRYYWRVIVSPSEGWIGYLPEIVVPAGC